MRKNRKEVKTRQLIMACLAMAGLFFAGSVFAGSASNGSTLSRISDSVYAYVGTSDDSASNSFGANAGIIIGKDSVLVVDTLISNKKAKAFIKDIQAITDKPIRFVVNTHSHVDHSYGNNAFAKLGAIIISHRDSKKDMERVSQKILDKADIYMGLNKQQMEGTQVVYPQFTFTGQMEIDLGGLKVVLDRVAHSHSKGSVFVYIPGRKVLFAGDTLFTEYYVNMGSSNIDGWAKTIDHLMGLDINHIIPGHGPLSEKKQLADMRGVFEILCHGSSLRFTSAISGSGSQTPRMGTPKTVRRRGLASAGAGLTTLQLFSDNKYISYF